MLSSYSPFFLFFVFHSLIIHFFLPIFFSPFSFLYFFFTCFDSLPLASLPSLHPLFLLPLNFPSNSPIPFNPWSNPARSCIPEFASCWRNVGVAWEEKGIDVGGKTCWGEEEAWSFGGRECCWVYTYLTLHHLSGTSHIEVTVAEAISFPLVRIQSCEYCGSVSILSCLGTLSLDIFILSLPSFSHFHFFRLFHCWPLPNATLLNPAFIINNINLIPTHCISKPCKGAPLLSFP